MKNILELINDLNSHKSFIIEDVVPENKDKFVSDYDDENNWFIDLTIYNEEAFGDGEVYFNINSNNLKTIEINIVDDCKEYAIETEDEFFIVKFPKEFKKRK